MRTVIKPQLQLGEVDIGSIRLDFRSRDDIPQILRGLQHIYTDEKLRLPIFALLEQLIPESVDLDVGRPGMALWQILVMGCLRLSLNCDYDRLLELANHHKTIRQILGHGQWDDDRQYKLQTLKDNVHLFTPEILDEINQVVVRAGHALKKKDTLAARCDSFVVETHVHYPTDSNLLWDALRTLIALSVAYACLLGLGGWRQSAHHRRRVKRAWRVAQRSKASTSNNPEKQQRQRQARAQAYRDYIALAWEIIAKSRATLAAGANSNDLRSMAKAVDIEAFIAHAERQIDQIQRRVLQGEKIPHEEKVFSLFQPHTEWNSKGKAGVPVELGVKVCIVEDTDGYLLHHRVMEKVTDEQIAVDLIDETQARYPNLRACSFDRGFHSPSNQVELPQRLDHVILPKKGRCNQQEQCRENSEPFQAGRRRHAAVESGINALEVHGLDRCPDHGIEGFKRYVALAVLARNIQKLGTELQKKERAAEQRRRQRQSLAA